MTISRQTAIILLIVIFTILLAGGGGAAYYFLVYKKRKGETGTTGTTGPTGGTGPSPPTPSPTGTTGGTGPTPPSPPTPTGTTGGNGPTPSQNFTSADICTSLLNKYGAVPGKDWGKYPKDILNATNLWKNYDCNTNYNPDLKPDQAGLCNFAVNSTDPNLQQYSYFMTCPRSGGMSNGDICATIYDKLDYVPGQSWGKINSSLQDNLDVLTQFNCVDKNIPGTSNQPGVCAYAKANPYDYLLQHLGILLNCSSSQSIEGYRKLDKNYW